MDVLSDRIGLVVSVTILYAVSRAVYNVAFHPLRKFPGPRLRAATRLPYTISKLRGDPTQRVKLLHDKYGHVVRIAPDVLSFTNSQAWTDIYGPKQSAMRGNIPKDPMFYRQQPNSAANIPAANDADHRRLRRVVAPGFSERAVVLQEDYLKQYTSLFITRLHEMSSSSDDGTVDIVRWLTVLTTDIIGDLAFGESFGGLDNGVLHPWFENVFWMIKYTVVSAEMLNLPSWVFQAAIRLLPRKMREKVEEADAFAEDKLRRRVAMGTDRPDLMSYALKGKDQGAISDGEITQAALTFIMAGSETTATMLSGCLYLLGQNPSILRGIADLIRSDFSSPADLTLLRLQSHEYLNAVLQESLRLYPPAPDAFFRRTTKDGAIVAGEVIPPNTRVTVNLWAANRSVRNFHRPDEFIPERWLKDCPVEFLSDDRAVSKPFSTGPRDCLGKTLAWAEMRLILASILWHFDIKLLPESRYWISQQKIFLWEKPELRIKLVPRKWE
ncbi:isotrichodermin C-15 hydroxylase [Whalleya microplaca]|nr:isotrichodermin C-15 hydroxylase [Whalleya microplaca]